MEGKKNTAGTRIIRVQVNGTHAFLALNKVQRDIINTGQNITAICKGLEEVKTNGVLHWEIFSQNCKNNREIIREIYTNSLEVTF
jgi:hypothetical protein